MRMRPTACGVGLFFCLQKRIAGVNGGSNGRVFGITGLQYAPSPVCRTQATRTLPLGVTKTAEQHPVFVCHFGATGFSVTERIEIGLQSASMGSMVTLDSGCES